MSAPLSIYYKKFICQLQELKQQFPTQKPRLLLHSCCGPCSSSVLELLVEHFYIEIFYYNPNIYPQTEYFRRLEEQKRFVKDFLGGNAPIVTETLYAPDDFYECVKKISGYESMGEKGERCWACYELRMKKAFEYAVENNFDFFTTTLSISPHKSAAKINEIGEKLEKSVQKNADEINTVKYLYADFKKKNGFKRSLELSNQYNLYRQDYCGCVFSVNKS